MGMLVATLLPMAVDWRKRLEDEIRLQGRDMKEVSIAAGLGSTYVRDALRRGRGGKLENLSKIAIALHKSSDWLTSVMPPDEPAPVPSFRGDLDLPLYAATEGGRGEMLVSSDPIDHVARPWFLRNVPDGYAVIVSGHSMEPRYDAGEYVWVHPRAPLVRNKDAIVHTAKEGGDFRAMIKTYLGDTADSWRLKQWNPQQEFTAKKREWPFAIRVVGRYDGI